MKNHMHKTTTQTPPATAHDPAQFSSLERRFGVNNDQIQRAIAAVGNSPEKVEDYLKGKLFSFLSYKHN